MEKTNRNIISLLVLTVLLLPAIHVFYAQVNGLTMSTPQATNYSFGAPQAVEHVPGVDDQPSALQLSNGTVWVAWRSNRGGGSYNIYLKSYNVTSRSWLTSVRLTTAGSNAYPSLSQFPNGTIILVWTSNLTRYDNLYYMTYSNRWSSAVQLTSGSFYDESSRAVVTGGSLWLVWERDTPTGFSRPALYHQIYYKTLVGGKLWTPDTALTTNLSVDSVSPTVTVSKRGLLWFAWSRNATTVYNIVYRTLNGTVWSGDSILTNGPATDSYPYMVQDRNGTMWLFWSRQVIPAPGVFQYSLFDKFSGDVGKTWTGDRQLTLGGTLTDPVWDIEPSTIQGKDYSLWLFYSSNQYFLDFDLYYMKSGMVFPVHDIAVTDIQVDAPWTYPWGYAPQSLVTITVGVLNLGDYDESTIAVTMQAVNTTTITIGRVLMNIIPSGGSDFAVLTWDTLATHAATGQYTIVASIPRITGETIGNAVDNRLASKYAHMVLLPGNLKKDGCITIIDAGMMGRAFGTTPSSPLWNPDADLDVNGMITIIDFGILAARFGKCSL